MYEFIHIVKENVLTGRIFVSLWRRCGVEPGRDEGAAVLGGTPQRCHNESRPLPLRDHLKTGHRGSLKIQPTETRGRELNDASLARLVSASSFSLLPLLFLALRMYRTREQSQETLENGGRTVCFPLAGF